MAGFNYADAAGVGTDTIDRSVLGAPFVNIVQKGSPEFDETHPKYAEKKIPDARPGNILFESEHVILPQPLLVVPLAQFPHYTEWKPNKGGYVGTHLPDIVTDPRYRKGNPGTPNEYREYLGANEIVFTITFAIAFKHGEEWKRGMIAFTSTQLKKARAWSKTIIKLEHPNVPAGMAPPIFAASYQISTTPESNAKGGFFGWVIGAPVILDPVADQSLLERAFAWSKKAQLELPKPRARTELLPPSGESGDEGAPY